MLLVQAGARLCALPIGAVIETLRPQPIEPMPGTAPFVRGVSVIRGEAVPVLDLQHLLEEKAASAEGRVVTIRVGERAAALLVQAVLGVRQLDPGRAMETPPLLGEVSAKLVARLAALDGQLLLVLDTARVVPDQVWHALRDRSARAD